MRSWRDRFYDEPQRVDGLPVGISGRLSRIAERDEYTLIASNDGPITVDFWGRRLGTPMNAAIQVEDSRGAILLDEADTEGRDLTVTFAAKEGEAYTLRIHDTDFRGARQFVYRVAIWDRPRVLSFRPARLPIRRSQMVEFRVWGLGSDSTKGETVTAQLEVGDETGNRMGYVLQTEAGPSIPIEMPLQSQPVQETLATASGPHALQPNQAVTGQLAGQ